MKNRHIKTISAFISIHIWFFCEKLTIPWEIWNDNQRTHTSVKNLISLEIPPSKKNLAPALGNSPSHGEVAAGDVDPAGVPVGSLQAVVHLRLGAGTRQVPGVKPQLIVPCKDREKTELSFIQNSMFPISWQNKVGKSFQIISCCKSYLQWDLI